MCKKWFAAIIIGLAVVSTAVQAVDWDRVAYWDDRVGFAWQGGGTGVRDALAAAGYTVMDADQLKTWMDARIADKKLSVVVFCEDVVPDTVAESQSTSCTIRQYLNAGGKVVWYADIPFYYQQTTTGTRTTWGDAGSTSILGFGAAAATRDRGDTVTITADGATWGLTQTWGSVRPALPADVDTILATDNLGNAAAWVKHYVANDSYRGFVRIRDVQGDPDAADVMRVAEFVPLKAMSPTPADGSTFTQVAGLLQWSPGIYAAQHHVYFGTSETDVANGTGGTDKGLVTQASYIAMGMTPGTTYYWRVDEVNDTNPEGPWMGDVWSFTVADTKAYNPNPEDGAIYVPKNSTLTWNPGLGVALQEFFIGTDYNTVLNATPGSGTILGIAGTRTPSGQAEDTTYYWRVDTYNQSYSLTKGDVWSYTTIPFYPIADPNLVAHYKLDEGQGRSVIDYSGHGHHGVFTGDPAWVAEAQDGGGLQFDGVDDSVHFGAMGMSGTAPRTVCGWAKASTMTIPNWTTVFGFSNTASTSYTFFDIQRRAADFYCIHVYSWERSIVALDLDWHYLAATFDGSAVRWYNDAGLQAVAEGTSPDTSLTLNIADNVIMGERGDNSNNFPGILDDWRIYDYALSPEELQRARIGDPTKAYDPVPKSGTTVSIDAVDMISWSAGDDAVQHDVYFGTDSDAVKNATTADAEYKIRQAGTSYVPAVVMGQTYYWRIDEVAGDSSISTGRLWSFTVLDYLVVDDFESYGSVAQLGVEGQRIWYVWLDGFGYTTPPPGYGGNGSGSMVDLGAVSVSGQSLRMDFNNTTVPYSQVEAATSNLLVGSNWNRNGVKALALSFRGFPPSIGGVTQNGTQYTIKGAGADIWNVLYTGETVEDGYHDEFHYMYVAMTPGTHTITAKVESLVNTNGWAKVGVMIRDSLDPKSQHVFAAVTPSSGIVLQNRPSLGAASYNPADEVRDAGTLAPATAPMWVRLSRQTDGSIEGRYSTDGVTWTLIVTEAAPTITITGTMYMGLAVCSHVAGTATTAVFSDVKVNGNPITGWSNQDVGILSNNGTDPLYVQLKSGATTKRIPHPDPMAIQNGAFQQWNIALSAFSPVSLSNVTNIAVGTGTPGGALGTSGIIYVDDIRLYPPRYIPGMLAPWAQDIVQDGTVDLTDVDVLVANWLLEDGSIASADPGTANLLAHYRFEGNANDSTGLGNHGTLVGNPTYVAGVPALGGQALDMDGSGDALVTDVNAVDLGISGATAKSITGWAYVRTFNNGGLWDFGTNANGEDFSLRTSASTNVWRTQLYGGAYDHDFRCASLNEWVHYAQVYDGAYSSIYANGTLVAQAARTLNTTGTKVLAIGRWATYYLDGMMDEVRVYNRALSQAEVAYLAGGAGTVYLPIMSPAEISETEAQGDRIVNFKDLALMLDKLGTTQVWPEP